VGRDRGQKGEGDERKENGSEGRREEDEEVKQEERNLYSNDTLNSISPTPLRCPHICVCNYSTSASVLFHKVISFVKYSKI
jgi:hypothetical protein